MQILRIFSASALCLFTLLVFAEIPVIPETELVPAEKHVRATEIITHIIDSYHYKNKELNDDLSASILDRYLESLDQNRSFFLAEDINLFSNYKDKLDEALINEDLTPAFEIFRQYRVRVDERVKYAINLLDRAERRENSACFWNELADCLHGNCYICL